MPGESLLWHSDLENKCEESTFNTLQIVHPGEVKYVHRYTHGNKRKMIEKKNY